MTSFVALGIPGVVLVTPQRFGDARGYFSETYSQPVFAANGIDSEFMQDNESLSVTPGTVRGLHFQTPPFAQAKLVRVIRGAVYDVAVDVRKGSPTYGRSVGARLSAEGGEQLFIPQGFAHAFCTLEANTQVAYKVDARYSREHDGGILWNDPDLGIEWPIAEQDAVLSDKDRLLPRLKDFVSPFQY